jgi:Zn-finger nucleic acid-binding protein
MRQYERSSVHVDQCTECRGIFLDRGELERLIDAEAAFNATPVPAPPPTPAPSPPAGYDRGYDSRGYEPRPDPRYDPHYHQRKKRKSFFEELFD